jgi:hypothetical protein
MKRPPPQFFSCPRVVIARIAANVRHIDANALTLPGEILRQLGAQLRVVNVPVDPAQGFKVSQSIKDFLRPKISRMPDLITLSGLTEDRVIQKSMRVGKQPDSHSQS